MEKLFHPTIEESKLCEPETEALDMAEWILHSVGWFTQQGMEEEAIGFLRHVIQLDRQFVVRVCAAGLAVLLERKYQKA